MSWSVSFTATSDNGVPSLTYFDTDYGLVTLSFQYQQHFFVLKKFVILWLHGYWNPWQYEKEVRLFEIL